MTAPSDAGRRACEAPRLTVGSLFSGIGGIDLGLQRAGFEIRWQTEIDDYCRGVLTKHWPNVPKYGDIKELTGHELEPVDLIAGGFPCQPVSLAGKRLGQDDDRWLWPEFIRLVRVVRPRYVLVENVPGLLVRGLGDVLGDLAASGFDAEWDCIPAAAVGAPHRRDRLWLVAHTNGEWQQQPSRDIAEGWRWASNRRETVADATLDGRRARGQGRPNPGGAGQSELALSTMANSERSRQFGGAPGENGIDDDDGSNCRRPKTFSATGVRIELDRTQWAIEPDVGRVAHGVPARVDRLRGLGNAVVPQVVEWIGRRILEYAS